MSCTPVTFVVLSKNDELPLTLVVCDSRLSSVEDFVRDSFLVVVIVSLLFFDTDSLLTVEASLVGYSRLFSGDCLPLFFSADRVVDCFNVDDTESWEVCG